MSAPSRARYRDALRARDLRLLLAAFAADSLGGWAYNVVLVVHLYDRTGSTAVIAATSACSWLPRLAVSPYAGVIADRYERRRVMLASAGSCALLVLLLAAGVALAAPVLALLALHALVSTCAAFYEPAAQALLPQVVPEKDLVSANALFGVVDNLAVIAGPALGGLFLLTGRPVAGFLFNAGTFLLAMAAVRALEVRSRGSASVEGGDALAQLRTGIAALRSEPVAIVLVLFAALSTTVYGALSLLQVPLSQRFGTGSEGYAYLIAALAAGGVLGAAVVHRLAVTRRLAPVIVGGLMVLALPLAAATGVTSPVLGAALQAVSGAGMVVVDVMALTALQRDLPGSVLSRVLGLLETLGLAGALLASVSASALLQATSLETTLLVFGLGFSALSLLGLAPLVRADRRAAAALAELAPRVAMLDRLDLLDGAPGRTLEQLAGAVQVQQVAAGQVVVREGDDADALYVIERGTLEVTKRGAGPLPALHAGEYFGEIGLLDPGPRTATVTTATPAVLWRVDAAAFAAALESGAASASLWRVSGARLSRSHPGLARRTTTRTPAARG